MPDAPPQIAPNGSAASPSAVPQIGANGSAASPASPPAIAGGGAAATPGLPPQVASPAGIRIIHVTGELENGSEEPVEFPPLGEVASLNGKMAFTADGNPVDAEWPEGEDRYMLYWYDGSDEDPVPKWLLGGGAGLSFAAWFSLSDTASPADAEDWEPLNSATGVPVLTLETSAPEAPPQIAANGSTYTPAAPPAIA